MTPLAHDRIVSSPPTETVGKEAHLALTATPGAKTQAIKNSSSSLLDEEVFGSEINEEKGGTYRVGCVGKGRLIQ
tara:strand:+ start:487 stop:711 length:225 start_codon:yes stop_codon:yes gene_type:complete